MKRVYSATAAASICCTVFGFSTLELRYKPIDKLKVIYCVSITTITSVFSAVDIHMKLANMNISSVSITYLILSSSVITILTYCRVQFISAKDIVNNILKNLCCIDNHLNIIGIRVRYRSDCIKCFAYICFDITEGILITNSFLQTLVVYERPDYRVSLEFKWVFALPTKCT